MQSNDYPEARSTKICTKKRGVEEMSKKEHGVRKNPGARMEMKKEQGKT